MWLLELELMNQTGGVNHWILQKLQEIKTGVNECVNVYMNDCYGVYEWCPVQDWLHMLMFSILLKMIG